MTYPSAEVKLASENWRSVGTMKATGNVAATNSKRENLGANLAVSATNVVTMPDSNQKEPNIMTRKFAAQNLELYLQFINIPNNMAEYIFGSSLYFHITMGEYL